ncbi:MAG: MarR family winged helix-turn-helix transcriptional regulator [Eubacteriales bacterium]
MTLEEEIVGMLRKLNAMSRRGKNPPDMPPPPPDENGNPPPPPPPPEHAREHGRGRIMSLLSDEGEMNQCQLAARLDIRPQSLSELLCKMECDGVISRRQSEEDKRQTLVSLTDEGRERLGIFRKAHREHAAEFLSPLSEEEKITLAALLKKLTESKHD